jgi:dinuclear metal center YbgI/SA1388 family protein
MNVSELMAVLDEIAPFGMQFSEGLGDNSGLVIGRGTAEVKRVMICLDLTARAVETAEKEIIDVIITHHPPIYYPIRKFTDPLLSKVVENRISVISMHTNYDSTRLNDILAEMLGIMRTERVLPYKAKNGRKGYLGRIGMLEEEMAGEDMIQCVKEELGVEYVRIIGDIKDMVTSAAVCQGSSSGYEKEMIDLGADVYVTGEVKYNSAVEFSNAGCFVIEAGHYETEKLFVSDLAEVMGFKVPELELLPFHDRNITTI